MFQHTQAAVKNETLIMNSADTVSYERSHENPQDV